MCKYEGKDKESQLQAYVAAKNLPLNVSVVMGPTGSYEEHDIINCLEKWLSPWGEGRRWDIPLLDVHAPGLTDNVQRLCWGRGSIFATHGGGASMILQTTTLTIMSTCGIDPLNYRQSA